MGMAVVPMEGDIFPRWIRILPLGRVELVDQRSPLEVDLESLSAMVSSFKSRGVDVVIDYEHQSLQGERAPAAGWVKELEARGDGLYARVEWTPQAQEYLRNREYRYFSPVLRLDPETRKPQILMQVALTNVPAIKGLAPLVAKQQEETSRGVVVRGMEMTANREKGKMREKLKGLMGLDPGTQDESLWARVVEVFRELGETLGLPEEAPASRLAETVAALKATSEQLPEVRQELEVLKSRLAEETVAQVVEEALKAGKIAPAQKDWALEYCGRDQEGFKAYIAGAPKVVPTGEDWQALRDSRGAGGLHPEELALCRVLHLAPEVYATAKAQGGKAQ